jgi:hypothetical protein
VARRGTRVRIRKYGEWPAFFVPDEGEVVLASRSVAGPLLRAAVTRVRRASREKIRVDFVWLEPCPRAINGDPIRVGQKGNVYIATDDEIPLIRRVTVQPAPHPAERGGA